MTLHDPVNLKYLVTGTGRCGTVYASRLLTSLGVPCGHESIFEVQGYHQAALRIGGKAPPVPSQCSRIGAPSDLPTTQVAEASYMAAPFLDRPTLSGTKLIHLVRHPVAVINSFVEGIRFFHQPTPVWLNETGVYVPCGWHQFIYRYVPELKEEMSPVDRAALYYVRWNLMVEKKGEFPTRIRLEDCPTAFFETIGQNSVEYYRETTANRSDYTVKWSASDISSKVRDVLVKMADRYGYDLEKGSA